MDGKTKVAIVRCLDYNPDSVYRAVMKIFDLLGGSRKFIHENDKVILKPNVLGAWEPDKAVTTHPALVAAVSRVVKEIGAFPKVGESSGCSAFNRTSEAFSCSGMTKMAEEYGLELINFDKEECVRIYVKEIGKELLFPRVLIEANVIISLPKLKTHALTGLTGSLKNMFGSIPGPRKGQMHKEFSDKDSFSKAMVAILKVVKPRLSIMDGILAMEGNGPAAGKPKKLGFLIASDDPVSLDTVVADKIMKINPAHLEIIQSAIRMGIGEGSIDKIEIVGDCFDSLSKAKFSLPVTYSIYTNRWFPEAFKSFFVKRIFGGKPIPKITDKCVFCGKCVEICPAHAMKKDKNKKAILIDLKKCISCFCCDEACEYKGVKPHIPLMWRLLKL